MKISLIAYFSHMQFVSELKQIDLMADEKAPVRISYRLLAINRSEMRINMEKKKIFVIGDRKSTRLNSSHIQKSRMPSSA